jgi:predicted metal-dependent hydrolase
MKYLAAYPAALRAQVEQLMAHDRLGDWLHQRYAKAHDIRTDRALYEYVNDLKIEFLRNAEPLFKVVFDNKLHAIRNALGTHTTISRIQGNRLKSKREIRVASLFKEVPIEWLRMIAVHELAHTKEREHGKAFYQLCAHMEPNYHQYEFDLRLYLTHLDHGGAPLWSASALA